MYSDEFKEYGNWNMWYSELHGSKVGITFQVKDTIDSCRSHLQHICIIDTFAYGKMLILDGSIMLTERDEFIYHEMISHPALFVHPHPKNVAVIGGGDGGTIREVTKHLDVQKVDLVEIDGLVIEKCKQHLPFVGCGYNDIRVQTFVMDGVQHIKAKHNSYQVILVDSTDPVGAAEALFQKDFFEDCYKSLVADGIMVAQMESPFYHPKTIKNTLTSLKTVFPIVKLYTAWIPTYPSGLWSFALCSKKYDPVADLRLDKFDGYDFDFHYFNKDIHSGAFALPSFVKKILNKEA